MGSVLFVKGNNHDVSPKQGPELESQLSILKLASQRVWCELRWQLH